MYSELRPIAFDISIDESAYKFQPIVEYDNVASSSSSSLIPSKTIPTVQTASTTSSSSLLHQSSMDICNTMDFHDMNDDDFDMEISTFFSDMSSPRY